MKKGKLVNVTTDELGNIAVILGAKKTLYRNAPLLNVSQIDEVIDEFEVNNCDSIIFDKGAIFDVPTYDIAAQCVERLAELKHRRPYAGKPSQSLAVVIYNAPEL